MNSDVPRRLLGLDWIRLVSFVAIATHHISWVYFYTLDIPVSEDSLVVWLFEEFARSLAFSGFTIVFLTTFLMGLRGRSPEGKVKFFLFLLGGWFLFSLLVAWESPFFFSWDVYALLFLGLAVAYWVDALGGSAALGAVGFGLLWVPFWELPALDRLPGFLKQVVVGDCFHDVAEWAVLPWIGLVWVGYGCGRWVRGRGISAPSRPLGRGEGLLWAALLLASLPFWGAYYRTPLGSQFACYVYRQPPHVFWAHLVWPIFLMRLSFDPRVDARLPTWVAGLEISKRFWLAYVVHYPLAYVFAGVWRQMEFAKSPYHPQWIAVAAVVFVPTVEGVCRILVRLWSSWSPALRKSLPRRAPRT